MTAVRDESAVRRMSAARSISCALALAAAALVAVPAGADDVPARERKLIVLGVDGMDPQLFSRFRAEGVLPNLDRLAKQGGFEPLGTSVPPQSPVAWSNFITGLDPGGHGIFDFVALDRKSLVPYLSTAKVKSSGREPLKLGSWRLPLSAEETVQLRDGQAFWELLEQHDIPTTLFRIPANYPPVETGGRALSGMGTPDLRGTPGTFSFFTDDPAHEDGAVSGGAIHKVRVVQGRVDAAIEGPPNAFRADSPATSAPFVVYVDPEHPVAEIRIAGQRLLLRAGEWSDWVPVGFELVPALVDVRGMVRFYLKGVRPWFRLYASPINIDPQAPAQPIATPAEYARELFEAAGPFYTQEMPEDTKALDRGVLTPEEFLAQSDLVLAERRRLLAHELRRFHEEQRRGLFFFYLSSLDQRSHMLWRQMDPEHPHYDADAPKTVAEALRTVYKEVDDVVGSVAATMDERTTLVVMSDHGFSPFRHQAHLNRWLEENGYLALKAGADREKADWLTGIDWRRTRAFGIGLNSLYLNVRGRERYGSVLPSERPALAREIADKLGAWTDPRNGQRVVTQALLREDAYSGPHTDEAPDILVGYARGYRASWATSTGKVAERLLEPNDHEWSGDHCMDARAVPGVLFASRPLRMPADRAADLRDLTVTLLSAFDVPAPAGLPGASVF